MCNSVKICVLGKAAHWSSYKQKSWSRFVYVFHLVGVIMSLKQLYNINPILKHNHHHHHHVLLRHVGSNREHTKCKYTTTNTPFKTQLKHTKNTRRRHAVYTLLNCADECFPYSTFYCLLVDVNRRQTVTGFQWQQIFVIPSVTRKVVYNYQK